MRTLAASRRFFWAVAIELVIHALGRTRSAPSNRRFGIDDHRGLRRGLGSARPPTSPPGNASKRFFTRLRAHRVREGSRPAAAVAAQVRPNAGRASSRRPSSVRAGLSSLVLIEYVFIWGGAGLTFVQALGTGRLELAIALAVAFAAGSAVLTFAADLARARVRVET